MSGSMGQGGLAGLFGGMGRLSVFPSADVIRAGEEQMRYGKEPVRISKYGVEVFNMMDPERRNAYCSLISRLTPLVQDAHCCVCRNELQVLTDKNGSGWFRYVEWFEYELNNKSLTTDRSAEDSPEHADDGNNDGERDEDEDDF